MCFVAVPCLVLLVLTVLLLTLCEDDLHAVLPRKFDQCNQGCFVTGQKINLNSTHHFASDVDKDQDEDDDDEDDVNSTRRTASPYRRLFSLQRPREAQVLS